VGLLSIEREDYSPGGGLRKPKETKAVGIRLFGIGLG
jgi:hypothetical protein